MATFNAVFTPNDDDSTTLERAVEYYYDLSITGTAQYIQRVYSSGLSAWCYYTQAAINPTPLAGETTPNWTGAITVHQVLSII